MQKLTKEELAAQRMENAALGGMHERQHSEPSAPVPPAPDAVFDTTMTAHSRSDADPLIQRHFAQQRLRLEVYEHQIRNGLIVAENSGWTNGIANPWKHSDVSARLHLKALEESEQTWRAAIIRETNLTMDRVLKILQRVYEDAIEKLAKEGEETSDMKAVSMEEKELRQYIREQYLGAAASAVLMTIEPEERAWRAHIFRDYADSARKVWGRVLGAQFLWLLSPAGGAGGVMSEAEQRLMIYRAEWFSRASAAVRFCQLQLQWHEEWERMTRLFVEKLHFQYTRLAFRIQTDELNARRALASLYAPLSADIHEQLDEHLARKRRQENKLQALKNLRAVELTRSSANRFESDDYVALWRQKELAEIEALHNQILHRVAQFYTNDRVNELSSGQTRQESPALQKLRAFAASASPSPTRSGGGGGGAGGSSGTRERAGQQHASSSEEERSGGAGAGGSGGLAHILKLDQALIDLHSHHEDVMAKLAAPTTSFEEISSYLKQLQRKSGSELTAAAELEVKQLKGALNAELASIQSNSQAVLMMKQRNRLQSGGALSSSGFMMTGQQQYSSSPSPSPVRLSSAALAEVDRRRGVVEETEDETTMSKKRKGSSAQQPAVLLGSEDQHSGSGAGSPVYDEDLLVPANSSLDNMRQWCQKTLYS